MFFPDIEGKNTFNYGLIYLLKQPIVLKYLGRRLRKQMNEVCKNEIFLINRLKIQGYSSITIDRFPQVYELEYPTTNNRFQIYQKLLLFH